MATIHIYGAKGGVGTTTVSALVALDLQHQEHAVILKSSAGNQGDLRAILGLATGYEDEPINFVAPAGSPVVTVIDHGTTPPAGDLWATRESGDRVFLVIRPCYLGLRRALAQACRPDGIILLVEKDRSLGVRDVEEVLGVKVVSTIDVEPRIARAIDAGLLSSSRYVHTLRLPVSV